MRILSLKIITFILFTALGIPLASAQRTDLGEVGRQVAIMLQNSHFARMSYNEELSKRFLDDYIQSLDSQRLFFTQQDITRFNEQYGKQLHTMLLQGSALNAATDIYRVYHQKVEARVAEADALLVGPDWDFELDQKITMSRKDVPWPKDEAEAKSLWSLQIKESVLGEVLRREMVAKLAKDQNKPNPSVEERSPKEKVALRYKRLLTSVRDADDEEIANSFFSSVARSYDPHTDYMSPREMTRFKDGMKNELVGIGALLQGEEDGATKIKGIVVGGPADKEGILKLNDRIVAVDSLNTGKPNDMTDVMFMKIDKVVDLIRGKEGTSVALKVEPAGGAVGETKLVVIPRGKVEMKDEQASGEVIRMKGEDGKIKTLGVIILPAFYSDFEEGKVSCATDVENILKRLVAEKIDGLILDLRNNGGGSLEEVRRMTGFFSGKGPVVQVKNTLGQVQVKDSEHSHPIYNGPLVVLTNRTSASASEILAGALQDYQRAVIVGEASTFGKGTVQQPMDIGKMLPLFAARSQAGFLKVTIQKFYRPSGSSTQMDGVVSDISVPSITDSLELGEKYLPNALPHDRIRNADQFKSADNNHLFLSELKKRSQQRMSESKDFAYTIEDIMQLNDKIHRNEVSLRKSDRQKDLLDSEAKQKQRNKERHERFAKIQEQEKKQMTFYKLNLDDLSQKRELKAYDPSEEATSYMRKAKNEVEDLDEAPKWPNGIDPLKREAMFVLRDMVNLSKSATQIVDGLPKS